MDGESPPPGARRPQVRHRPMVRRPRGAPIPPPGASVSLTWKEKILKKAMQMHYAGMSLFERMRSARITGWM